MRIAFVYDAVYPFVRGGAERRIYEIATRLARRGHDVSWLGLQWWPGDPARSLDGINLRGLAPAVKLYSKSGRRSVREALYFGAVATRRLMRSSWDIIDCGQFPYFHLVPARLASLRRGTMVVSWYEVWGRHWFEYLGPFGLFGLIAERVATWLPDHLIAVSTATGRDLRSLGVRPKKVTVIPNGVDRALIAGVPKSNRSFDLLYVGRLKAHKNVDLLIEASAKLVQKHPALRVGVVGDGPERGSLQSLALQLKLADHVSFLGSIPEFPEVVAIMKSARLFVHPSTKEGGGSLTVLEANASGLPVVAFRHPHGIDTELITSAVNGVWIDQVSGEALAVEIDKLLSDRARLESMKASSIAHTNEYDWDRIVEQHESLYLSLSRIARA